MTRSLLITGAWAIFAVGLLIAMIITYPWMLLLLPAAVLISWKFNLG